MSGGLEINVELNLSQALVGNSANRNEVIPSHFVGH
jgi:hypothetical protein